MTDVEQGLIKAELSNLVDEQLTALKQVISVSGELARRLHGEDFDWSAKMSGTLSTCKPKVEQSTVEPGGGGSGNSNDDQPGRHAVQEDMNQCFGNTPSQGAREVASLSMSPAGQCAGKEAIASAAAVDGSATCDLEWSARARDYLDYAVQSSELPTHEDAPADVVAEPPGTNEAALNRATCNGGAVNRACSDYRLRTVSSRYPDFNVRDALLPRAQTDSELVHLWQSSRLQAQDGEDALDPLLGDFRNLRSHTDTQMISMSRLHGIQLPSEAPGSPLAEASAKRVRAVEPEHRGGLFIDKSLMKQELRSILSKTERGMEDLYHETGWSQWLARHEHGKTFSFMVIILSCFWIGIETDLSKPDASHDTIMLCFAIDNLFLTFFTVEIFVRWAAFERRVDALKFFDFTFDLGIVLLMLFDTWVAPLAEHFVKTGLCFGSGAGVFRILRLMRLLRLTRLGRLLRSIPDVVILVKGLITAVRAVLSTLLLILILIYAFAVVLTQMLSGSNKEAPGFGSVLQSMETLFLEGVFPDAAAMVRDVTQVHWAYFFAMTAYLCLCCLAGMNLLTGVIVDTVNKLAIADKDARAQVSVQYKLHAMLLSVDKDMNSMISLNEFRELLKREDFVSMVVEADIDVYALVESGDLIIFHDDDDFELPFEEFIDALMKFRNCNHCTVKDAVDVRMSVIHAMKEMEDRILDALPRTSNV